ncbi:MFS transporter [Bordetella genomosp. 11]|uniref:MFS transporter n=1 Tax=Bordetella genomosp. 11 TaxID=1416808 RepID=A0A261UIU0_9BORD|nr:MFS transporter [Bordetella genomosp. 11]OZI61150.1 MFS transporter [Bordetella genomosp. 11]
MKAATETLAPAWFLALGTFAIGTEGFMIAPLLSTMAADFYMSVPEVALLVIVFTLTMSLSSPISTVLSARLKRRDTLLFAMAMFAAGNLVAAWSPHFGVLMGARVLMAVASGLYVPNANALAGVIVSPHKRGRALAIVSGGMTLAIALGLPLGAVVGHAFGWRATFLAVGVMSLTAMAGIRLGVARDAGAAIPVATLAQRAAVVRQPAVLRLLAVSLFWSIGAYAAYPYIAPYLTHVLGFEAAGINATVSLWGLAAALGVTAGGTLNDRYGSRRVARASLLVLALSFWLLALAAVLAPNAALIPVLVGVVLWGFTVWAFFPAQMARLIAAGDASQASVALALNTSTMYLGFSIGSAVGAAILDRGVIAAIGVFAGAAEFLALALDRRAGAAAHTPRPLADVP